MRLFQVGSPWPAAQRHIQVVELDTVLVQLGTDSQLKTIFAYLKGRNIAVGLTAAALTATAKCGMNVEGYGEGSGTSTKLAQRIKSLGGELAYVDWDEPLFFGHYSKDKGACQMPIQSVAEQAGATARAFKAVFPGVQIGDTEPMNAVVSAAPAGTWLAGTKQWVDGFRTAAGFPLAFLQDDAAGDVPYNKVIPELRHLLAQEHVRFGMLFVGADDPSSDAHWMASAQEHVQAYNHSGNPPPEQVNFASWDPYPTHNLPESSPTALTHLVNFYFSPQARSAPDVKPTKHMIPLVDGAVVYRTTCDLDAISAAGVNPPNEANYVYCLMQARGIDPETAKEWGALLANGSLKLQHMMDENFESAEFQTHYSIASLSRPQFVSFLYGLLLFRVPTEDEQRRYIAALTGGRTRQQVFDAVLRLPEFKAKNRVLSRL